MVLLFHSDNSYVCGDDHKHAEAKRSGQSREQEADATTALWHGRDAIRLYSAKTYLDHPTSPSLPDPNFIPHIPYMPLGTRHTRLGDNLPIPVVLPNLGGVSGLVVAQAKDDNDEERDKGKAENDKPKSIHRKALMGIHTYKTTITDDWRQELASASNELTKKAIWKYPFVAPQKINFPPA